MRSRRSSGEPGLRVGDGLAVDAVLRFSGAIGEAVTFRTVSETELISRLIRSGGSPGQVELLVAAGVGGASRRERTPYRRGRAPRRARAAGRARVPARLPVSLRLRRGLLGALRSLRCRVRSCSVVAKLTAGARRSRAFEPVAPELPCPTGSIPPSQSSGRCRPSAPPSLTITPAPSSATGQSDERYRLRSNQPGSRQ